MQKREVKEGIKKILEYESERSLREIELKICPTVQAGLWSSREAIKRILKYARMPSEILRKKALKKATLETYLKKSHAPYDETQSKHDYIRTCLRLWHVQDDDFLDYFPDDSLTRQEFWDRLRALEKERDEEIAQLERLKREEEERMDIKLGKDIQKLQKECREQQKGLQEQLDRGKEKAQENFMRKKRRLEDMLDEEDHDFSMPYFS